MKFIVWSHNDARPASKRPLPLKRANRLADLLELRYNTPMLVMAV